MASDVSSRAVAASPGPTGTRGAHLQELVAVPRTGEYLKRMWAKRDFIAALPIEQLRTSHQATLLGNVWHLGNPILSVAVYYVVFGIMLDTSRGIDNFILFLVIGIFTYRLTSDCMVGGAKAISNNTGLMRAVRFPRAALPLAKVFSNLMTFGFELLIIAALALATGEGVSLRWLALPAVIAVQSVLNLGGALICARLNDMFRDVQQIIPFVMRLGMYGSGVMFNVRERVEDAPRWVQLFVDWNPMVAMVDMYRWVFMGSAITGREVVHVLIVAFVLLVVGFKFFVSAEASYGRG